MDGACVLRDASFRNGGNESGSIGRGVVIICMLS